MTEDALMKPRREMDMAETLDTQPARVNPAGVKRLSKSLGTPDVSRRESEPEEFS
jgi:hypothetical protein